MAIKDFTDKTWRITSFENSPECEKGEVQIRALENGEDGENVDVEVQCEKAIYTGKYLESDNSIDLDTHVIRLQVSYRPKDTQVPIGGSWTAEDTTGGVGGGGE
jgi:hypothetical protein